MVRQLESGQSIDPLLASAISGAPRAKRDMRGDAHSARVARKRRDKFYVPLEAIPKGWVVEWKRKSCLGRPEEADYKMELNEAGWRFADPKMFPMLVPEDSDSKIIERGGMVLMIRAAHLKKQDLKMDHAEALDQVRDKLAEIGMTGQGEAPRKAFNFNREYESRPTVIPENDGEDPDTGFETGGERPRGQ